MNLNLEQNVQDVVTRIFKIKERDPELAECLLKIFIVSIQASRPDIAIHFEEVANKI